MSTSCRRRSIQGMTKSHYYTNGEEPIIKTKLFKIVIIEFIWYITWIMSYYLLIPYMSDFDAKFFSVFIAVPVTIIFTYYTWFKKRTPTSNTKNPIGEWK